MRTGNTTTPCPSARHRSSEHVVVPACGAAGPAWQNGGVRRMLDAKEKCAMLKGTRQWATQPESRSEQREARLLKGFRRMKDPYPEAD